VLDDFFKMKIIDVEKYEWKKIAIANNKITPGKFAQF